MTRWLGVLMLVACGCSTSSSTGAGGSGSTSSSASTASASSTGGAPGCVEGPVIADNPACEACQNAHCCVTAANCVQNPDCLAVETCVQQTHSAGGCYKQHPGGTWDWSGLETCRKNQCAAECGIDPGACGNITPTPASCTAQVNQMCCDITSACGKNDACLALIYQCLDKNSCSTPSCVNTCEQAYPEGKTDFLALTDCWGTVPCL